MIAIDSIIDDGASRHHRAIESLVAAAPTRASRRCSNDPMMPQ
jgi:hypothetical protein